MFRRREIILGKKEHRRRHVAPFMKKFRWIIALFLIISFVAWSSSSMLSRQRRMQAQMDISRIIHATRLFRADFNRCPETIHELLNPPEGMAYIDGITDPWGRTYILNCPVWRNPDDVEVISLGPDQNDNSVNIKNLVVDLNQ